MSTKGPEPVGITSDFLSDIELSTSLLRSERSEDLKDKPISIGFCDFWPDFDPFNNFFVEILSKKFTVTVNNESPDFLFCSLLGDKSFDFSCTKIVFIGENITPDFNIFDYALGFDWINFDDRYFRLPLYRLNMENDDFNPHDMDFFCKESASKSGFCNFLYSNNWCSHPIREQFFHLLSQYKKVDSGGGICNNLGYRVSNKHAWQRTYKFSIAFENSLKHGYTTEKLYQALCAHTVPIYWGNPRVAEEFNSKRFINVHEYATLEDVVARVRELDSDPQKFLAVLSEPYFVNNPPHILTEDPDFEKFLVNIIRQGPEKSKRVTRDGFSRNYYAEMRAMKKLKSVARSFTHCKILTAPRLLLQRLTKLTKSGRHRLY